MDGEMTDAERIDRAVRLWEAKQESDRQKSRDLAAEWQQGAAHPERLSDYKASRDSRGLPTYDDEIAVGETGLVARILLVCENKHERVQVGEALGYQEFDENDLLGWDLRPDESAGGRIVLNVDGNYLSAAQTKAHTDIAVASSLLDEAEPYEHPGADSLPDDGYLAYVFKCPQCSLDLRISRVADSSPLDAWIEKAPTIGGLGAAGESQWRAPVRLVEKCA